MGKIKTYLYEKTGLFVDWDQLKKLPEIDTLIDIGVGEGGTPDFYERYPNAELILIDPLNEALNFAETNLKSRKYTFHQTAVGEKIKTALINVEESIDRSSLLEVTKINDEFDIIEKREINMQTLDNLICDPIKLGKIGIKIDAEGYELKIINGAQNVLKYVDFVVAEVRHNIESYKDQYKLKDFVQLMMKNNFVLSRIITAKPLIADLCFEKISDLSFNIAE